MTAKGGFVEVPIDPEFPEGWKKKVYEMNGRLVPRWTIWYDTEGNKFVNETKVRAKLAEIKERESKDMFKASFPANLTDSKSEDLRIVYNARKSSEALHNFTCKICSLDFASSEEYKNHQRLHTNVPCPPQIGISKSEKFTNISDYGEHLLNHTNIQPSYNNLGNHRKENEYNHPPPKNDLYKQEQKENAGSFNSGLMTATEDHRVYCDVCDKGYSTRKNMIRHRRKEHPSAASYDDKTTKDNYSFLKSYANVHDPTYSSYQYERKQESLQSFVKSEFDTDQFKNDLSYKSMQPLKQMKEEFRSISETISHFDRANGNERSKSFFRDPVKSTHDFSFLKQSKANTSANEFDVKQLSFGDGQGTLFTQHFQQVPETVMKRTSMSSQVGLESWKEVTQLPPPPGKPSIDYTDREKQTPHPFGIPQYMCEFCNKAFDSRPILKAHRTREHPGAPSLPEEPANCDICGNLYKSRRRMLDHRRTVHKKVLAQVSESIPTNTKNNFGRYTEYPGPIEGYYSNISSNESKYDDDLDNECATISETLINKKLCGPVDNELGGLSKETKLEIFKQEGTKSENSWQQKTYEVNKISSKEMLNVAKPLPIEEPHFNVFKSEEVPQTKRNSDNVMLLEEEDLDENVPIEDMDIEGLDEVYDEDDDKDGNLEMSFSRRNENNDLNTSLDIVTDFYNTKLVENSKTLSLQEAIKAPEKDYELNVAVSTSGELESGATSDVTRYLNTEKESHDTSLDRVTDFYNQIIIEGSANQYEVLPTEYINTSKNRNGEGMDIEKLEEKVSDIDDEIMLSPGTRDEPLAGHTPIKAPRKDVCDENIDDLTFQKYSGYQEKKIEELTYQKEPSGFVKQTNCEIVPENNQRASLNQNFEKVNDHEFKKLDCIEDIQSEELAVEKQENIEIEKGKIAKPNIAANILHCKICSATFSKKKHLKKHLMEHKSNLLVDITEKESIQNEVSAEKSSITEAQSTLDAPQLANESQNALEITDADDSNVTTEITDIPLTSVKLSSDRPYICYICKKGFTLNGNLTKHLQKIHKVEPKRKSGGKFDEQRSDHCNEIDFQRKRGIELTEDMPDKIDSKKTKLSEEFQCNRCSRQFKLQSSLAAHNASVHDGLKQSCNYCDYKAISKPQVKLHEQAEHEGVTHPCEFCNHVAKFRTSLLGHMKRNHADKF